MNNSKIVVEHLPEEPDKMFSLREKETELISLIDCLQRIQSSAEWSTLKTKLFDNLASRLVKEIQSEAREEQPDSLRLNRLSGELKWAERYADLSVLQEAKRLELTQIRKLLYGKTQERLDS